MAAASTSSTAGPMKRGVDTPLPQAVPRYRPKAPGDTNTPRAAHRFLLRFSTSTPPPRWNRALPTPAVIAVTTPHGER